MSGAADGVLRAGLGAGAGSAVNGDGGDDPSGGESREGRSARAALTRVVEPGDELVGRWLREIGPVELLRLFTAGGKPPSAASEARMTGYRLRAGRLDPDADLAAAEALGGRFVCPGDGEWPRQLDDLGDGRPIGLWVRGRPSLRLWALRSVAVVGARTCTDYGAHVASRLGAGLAEQGWVVVSGAAYGVDGAAHRGALAVAGATVAVLACGIDVPYPRGHSDLLQRIAHQGLVIAELPPGGHPTRSRFVLRNRVIAALTRGTVVVEAEYRSGSLVTARSAQRLGRMSAGVPGPVTSGLSAGVHELLRGEAALVTDASEIVELVGGMGDLAPERRGPVVPRDLLAPVAARVLEAMPADGGTDGWQLAHATGTVFEEVMARLYELLSLGFVERHGERWELAPSAKASRAPRRGGP